MIIKSFFFTNSSRLIAIIRSASSMKCSINQYSIISHKIILPSTSIRNTFIGQNCRSFSDGSDSETMKLFEKAKPLISDQLKNEINATMVFCISGKNFLFDSHSSRPLKIEPIDEAPKDVDVTMITDEKTFMKLAKGEMKAANAFMAGKLKIKGNVQVAMKAEKMFKALQK